MTSLMWAAKRGGAPVTEDEVRSTLHPVNDDAPPAALDEAPDYNEYEAYPENSQGLSTHQESGAYTLREKYPPSWAADASNDFESAVNRQVSSSGTAAARETAGEFGHGTMYRQEAIEPTLRDGAAFGADYFTSNVLGANETGGDYMTPQVGDPQMNAVAQAFANSQARSAAQSSLYGAWLGSAVRNG